MSQPHSHPNRMMRRAARWWRRWRMALFWLVAGLLGAAGYLWLNYYRPHHRLIISAGSLMDTTRWVVAQRLVDAAARRGVACRLQATSGSEAALDQVNSGQADVAFVQGALRLNTRPNVREVTPLYIEPLHLIVKREIYEEVLRNLSALEGKTVDLGGEHTGTYRLAAAVMEFIGLAPGDGKAPRTYRAVRLDPRTLLNQARRDDLPDAVFHISILPSSTIAELVTRHDYRLVPLPFAEAFALGSLTEQLAEERPPPGDPAAEISREHVVDMVIPAFTYQAEPPVPPDPLHTLGTRLLLIAHKDVSADAIQRLIEAAFDSAFARLGRPPLSPALLDLPPEIERHAGTLAYLRQNQPLITGDLIDMLNNSLGIFGAVGGTLLFLWQWGRQRAQARREATFQQYIQRLARIEHRAARSELSATLDLQGLLELQRELTRLRSEVVEHFADGQLDSQELLAHFLAHINASRDYLARLILHQRDNLEATAAAQGCSPDALWIRTVGPVAPDPSAESDPTIPPPPNTPP